MLHRIDSPTTKNGLAHSVKSLEVENPCYKHGFMGGREERKEGRSGEPGTSRERKQKRMILVGCSTPTPTIVFRNILLACTMTEKFNYLLICRNMKISNLKSRFLVSLEKVKICQQSGWSFGQDIDTLIHQSSHYSLSFTVSLTFSPMYTLPGFCKYLIYYS